MTPAQLIRKGRLLFGLLSRIWIGVTLRTWSRDTTENTTKQTACFVQLVGEAHAASHDIQIIAAGDIFVVVFKIKLEMLKTNART